MPSNAIQVGLVLLVPLIFAGCNDNGDKSLARTDSLTSGDIACVGANSPSDSLNTADQLAEKAADEIWAEYMYNVQCLDDADVQAAALDELVRRSYPPGLHAKAVILLYNGDPVDDSVAIELLKRAASLGHSGARIELESMETQHVQ